MPHRVRPPALPLSHADLRLHNYAIEVIEEEELYTDRRLPFRITNRGEQLAAQRGPNGRRCAARGCVQPWGPRWVRAWMSPGEPWSWPSLPSMVRSGSVRVLAVAERARTRALRSALGASPVTM